MDHVELREGSRVALLVPGSLAYLDLVMSLLAAGMFPIPLDPRLTPYERERILAGLCADLVVDPRALASMVPHTPGEHRGGPPGPADARHQRHDRHAEGRLERRPRPGADARALVDEERDLWGFTDTDVNLVLSPLYHSAPLRFASGTTLAGGRVVAPGPFEPARITAAISRERPTTMFCVPAHLQRLFAHWDEHGWPDLSSFRLVAHAGAPCPPDLKRRLVEAFPEGRTWEFYGSTEGQFTACRSEEWLERARHGRSRPPRPPALASTTTGPSGARCRRTPAGSTTATRRRPPPPGAAMPVHRPGRGPARRRRLPVPRGPPPRPDHQRRGQRLPAGGRERPARAPRGRRHRGLRRPRRPLGPAGVRGGRRHRHGGRPGRVRARAAGTTQAAQGVPPPALDRCRAR